MDRFSVRQHWLLCFFAGEHRGKSLPELWRVVQRERCAARFVDSLVMLYSCVVKERLKR